MSFNFEHWQPQDSIFQNPDLNSYEDGSKVRKNTGNYYHKVIPLFLAFNFTYPPTNFFQPDNSHFIANSESSHLISSPSHPVYHARNPQPLEKTGAFKTWYRWKQIDFLFPSEIDRMEAIDNGDFIQENVLPLGIEIYKDRIFVAFPKWKTGIPYTLGVLPKIPTEESPLLIPYPSWDFHRPGSCDSLTSVFRMQTDKCGRLWVLDSGLVEISIKAKQICPPTLFIFDLNTDRLIHRYELPQEFVKQDSLYSNLIVDVRGDLCEDAYAYLTDVWRFGLVIYNLEKNRSWRVSDNLFFPDPIASAFNIHGINFEWTDGIFSLALSPEDRYTNDRVLFFHPMASFREFFIPTSLLKNESDWINAKENIKILGQSRGKNGHAAGAGMDRRGVLFYNLISKDGVACWDSRKPYKRSNIVTLVQNSETMFFPNDIRMDKEEKTSIWIMTNRLPAYLYKSLDKDDYNFRIISAYTDEAIKDTPCDPETNHYYDFESENDRDSCE